MILGIELDSKAHDARDDLGFATRKFEGIQASHLNKGEAREGCMRKVFALFLGFAS